MLYNYKQGICGPFTLFGKSLREMAKREANIKIQVIFFLMSYWKNSSNPYKNLLILHFFFNFHITLIKSNLSKHALLVEIFLHEKVPFLF